MDSRLITRRTSSEGVEVTNLYLLKNSATVSILTAFGVASGLGVDVAVAGQFGIGTKTDAFFVAMTVPYMISTLAFATFAAGLIPLFARRIEIGGLHDAGQLFGVLLKWSLVGGLLLAVLGIIASPLIISVIAPGLDGSSTRLAIQLSRIMFGMVLLVGAVEVTRAFLFAQRKFAIPSSLNVARNATVLAAIFILRRDIGIVAVAVGYLAGMASSMLVLVVALAKYRQIRHAFSRDLSHPGLRGATMLVGVPALGLVLRQGVVVAERFFGSYLPDGSITALSYASKVTLVIGDLLTSINTAATPQLSTVVTRGAVQSARTIMVAAMRLTLLLAVPLVVTLGILRAPLVRLLFQRGAFDQNATLLTATVLGFYSLSLLPLGPFRIIQSYFYAALKAHKAALMFLLLTSSALILDLGLVRAMGAAGLALSFSCSVALATAFSFWLLTRETGSLEWRALIAFCGKTCTASGAMGLTLHAVHARLAELVSGSTVGTQAVVLGLVGSVGIAVFVAVALLLRVEEVWEVVRYLGTRPGRPHVAPPHE